MDIETYVVCLEPYCATTFGIDNMYVDHTVMCPKCGTNYMYEYEELFDEATSEVYDFKSLYRIQE